MKKPRLEPFEILTANRRRNPLVAASGAKAPPAPADGLPKSVPEPKPALRDDGHPAATGFRWRRMLGRTLLTLRVTPLVAMLIGLSVFVIVGASFWRGYRAGSAELQVPEAAPAGSFEEIRRNRVVMFDEIEVDRGKLRR